MDTQQRANGRHRLVYRPRQDPGLEGPLAQASERIARAVLEAVAAVSPLQGGAGAADAQRRAVAADVAGAVLSEAFRMLAAGTARRLQQTLPGVSSGVHQRAQESLRAPLRPPPPVVDLTDQREARRGRA